MQISFQVDDAERDVIAQIAERAAKLDRQFNGRRAAKTLHHQMNITSCHANGNPLRLADLLAADDFNFVHDVFGIDRHLSHETGALENNFRPRFSAPSIEAAAA